ncbi:MAG: hypothetical protein AB8B79_21860 [Granulosicoccus sp.]
MKLIQHHQVAVPLALAVVLLATLIPGSPVEYRNFSHVHLGIPGWVQSVFDSIESWFFYVAVFDVA